MNTIWYHFIERDDKSYDVCAESFKKAVLNLAHYHGDASELFRKCLSGFGDDDIDGIVELYNHFVYTPIEKIYVVKESIYPAEK